MVSTVFFKAILKISFKFTQPDSFLFRGLFLRKNGIFPQKKTTKNILSAGKKGRRSFEAVSKVTYFNYAILACLLLLGVNILSAQTKEPYQCKGVHMLEERLLSAATDLDFRSEQQTGNYDIVYHRLEWDIDPGRYFIKGKVTSYFIPTSDGFDQINFDLTQELNVTDVQFRGEVVAFSQTTEDLLEIYLPETVLTGELDSVIIEYQGEPAVGQPFESFVRGFHGPAGDPIIWTLSEPFGAKNWWPCKQTLNDKIDSIDVYVRTPSEFRAASNGILAGERKEGDLTVYHWKHRYPITTYLVAIAVTNYRAYSDFVELKDGRLLEILNYVYPEWYDAARIRTPLTGDMIQLFEELFGPYPFKEEKYGHAQFGFPGGMEHQTMSFMVNFGASLIAHELAHQWFGNKVTCGAWNDIWVNEGFARYGEYLIREYNIGGGSAINWLDNEINEITLAPGGAVYIPEIFSEFRIFDFRLSYRKGGMILHMLRWKIGDEAFFQGLRNFLEDPELAFGYATGEDVKFHLEQASGLDLDEFFADWYYGEGYPTYTVLWSQSQEGQLSITLEQETSSPRVDFFELPVPIRLVGKDQTETLVLDHQFTGQTFTFDIPFEIGNMEIDPERWLISRNNQVIFTTSSKDQKLGTNAIQLSPNPVDDVLFLRLIDTALQVRATELFHVSGGLVKQLHYQGGVQQLDVSDLTSGAYYIRVWTNEGFLVKKFLKQ